MKHIGFLSFGHWTPSPQSQTRTASDALLQSIDLAVAAEELGADGAYFRVHHFARQLGSPFPLLAACRRAHQTDRDRHRGHRHALREPALHGGGCRRRRPHRRRPPAARHLARLARAGDRRLSLLRLRAGRGQTDADMARRHTEVFLDVLLGKGFAKPNPRPMFPNPTGLLRVEPHSQGLRERIWWGAGTNATAQWAAKLGMNLQSSTLKIDESGKPFHVQQAEQIRLYKAAWKEAGHARTPRVSVSRSIFALVDERDRMYFGGDESAGPDRLPRRQRARDLRPQLRGGAG